MNRIILITLLICASVNLLMAQQTFSPTSFAQAVYFDVSPPLREMKMIAPVKKRVSLDQVPNKIGKKEFKNLQSNSFSLTEDPVWQKLQGPNAALTAGPIQNFEGINNLAGVYPPDTQGDVSSDYYVQVVNLHFAVFSKTGTTLFGPAALSTIWTGIPAPWNGTNDGDPIVLYDQSADRWLISEFSLPSGNYAMLVAISQTNDPRGAWYRYVFQFGNQMPDYPKFGVWPDGYYLSVNQFTGAATWGGVGACALERAKMITGDPTAQMVYFNLGPSSNPASMLPGDWDGITPPPSGAPNPFVFFDDWSSPTNDVLDLWNFHVDWITPANSTFAHVTSMVTAPFKSDICTATRGRCIPQPGTTVQLESLSDRLMYRLQYRNFGSHQCMVVNHAVDFDNSNHSGVRWYELRNSGSAWSIHQQGTYAPDVNYRWMGSVCMNGSGDIALGYSVSNATNIYPGIRYTGRRASDPLGQMTVTEQTVINGSGCQTGSAARWGDYSMMSVDPADDKTFWYTNEYIQTTGGASWQTRIASFKFSNDPTVVTQPATAITINSGTLNGTVNPNGLATDAYFEWGTSLNYGNSTPIVSAGAGTTAVPLSANLPGLTAGTIYHYRLVAVNADGTVNGNDMTFTPGGAIVTTDPVTAITTTTAISGGNVLADGGSPVTGRGVCWSLTAGPTVTDSHTSDGSGLGTFISTVTGLSSNTNYFLRAYATNGTGTYYGDQLQFQTLCTVLTPPYLETFPTTTIPPCWSQVDHMGNGQVWQFGTITGYSPNPNLTPPYAFLNSDAYGSGGSQNADLVSPVFDLTNHPYVTLEFKHYFEAYTGSSGKVYYSIDNGTSWTLIQSFTSTSLSNPAIFSIGLPQVGGFPQVKFKWNYTGSYGFFWAVDDISLTSQPLVVLPSNRNVGPAPGSANFSVYTNQSWTASSNQSWCTVTPSGTGPGTFTATFTANPVLNSRTATITVTVTGYPAINVTLHQSGLIPPENLQATVILNDVGLTWNQPQDITSQPVITAMMPRPGYPDPVRDIAPYDFVFSPSPVPGPGDALWDLFFSWSTTTNQETGVVCLGDYIYTCRWSGGPTWFYKYQKTTGTQVETFDITGITAVRDFASDGTFAYATGYTSTIYKLDLPNHAILSSISAPGAGSIRHIAYDPINNGFWCGDWTTMFLVSAVTGNVIATGPVVDNVYGSAYDPDPAGPYLWVHSQSGTNLCTLIQYKINGTSLSLTGISKDVGTMTGFPAGGSAGGLESISHAGKFGLLGDVQNLNWIFATELRTGGGGGNPPPGLAGFKLYRNGLLYHEINDPNSTAYDDLDLPAGHYSYEVTANYDLTAYGLPGQFGESAPEGPVAVDVTGTVTIGPGTETCYYPYTTFWETGRTQMLYSASEMIAAGASAGSIFSIGFNVLSNSTQTMEGFTVKMGQTTSTSLTGFAGGLSTVYNTNYAVPGTGWQDIPLTSPFAWNGTSNIIVEICFASNSTSVYSPVTGTLVPGAICGHFQDDNMNECNQTLFNTTPLTPRPDIRFMINALVVSPDAKTVAPFAGNTGYFINTPSSWTASSDQLWCTVTPSGSGSGELLATYTMNNTPVPRSAIITVTTGITNTYQVTLNQAGLMPPTDLAGSLAGTTAHLTWNAPANAIGLSGYNVYRYGVLLNTSPLTDTFFDDAGLTTGIYCYTVTAVYGSWMSAHTGPVQVSVGSGSTVVIGTGTNSVGWPYYTYYMASRTQMLYTAAELSAAGATAGNFVSVGFNVASVATQVMNNFAVKIGNTSLASLADWIPGLTTYYSTAYSVPGTGWRDIALASPFAWDGTSNVVVEICFANSAYTSNSNVYGTSMTNMVFHYHADAPTGGCTFTSGSANTPRPNIRFGLPLSTFVPPTNLQETTTGNDVHIYWDAPLPATGLLGYFVYRDGTLLTPVPITPLFYDDPDRPNGTYLYTVKAVYPTGYSSAAGPVQAIVSTLAPPEDLIAGTGFKNNIPLNWSPPAADHSFVIDNQLGKAAGSVNPNLTSMVDFYNIYRKTGPSGVYSLVGNTSGFGLFNPTTCYVDQPVLPGQVYYYKVTAVVNGSESPYSNEVSSTCNTVGIVKNIPASPVIPTMDGVINPAEWSDAAQFLIDNSLGVFSPPPMQPVMAFYKKSGNMLYIAVRDLADNSNNNDELGIYFDNNSNTIFDGTDGNYWIDQNTNGSLSITYRPISGTFPYNVQFLTTVDSPPGVAAVMGFNGGHREYEVSIDLTISALQPVNNTFKSYIFSWDQGPGSYTGYWPDGHVWPAAVTYADMMLLNTPLGAPVTTAGTVNPPTAGLISVPVNVTGFNDITALSLRLEYDPAVLTFSGISNIAPQLAGLIANSVPVSGSVNKIMLSWFNIEPQVILPGGKMFDLNFNYLGGSTALTWNNTVNGGGDCEYADASGNPLPDTPTSSYYIDGFVGYQIPTELNLNNIVIVNGQDTCFNATQTINIAGNGSTFTVQPGGSVTLIAGQKIRFYPGTTVQPGGYLQGYITTTGDYCSAPTSPEVLLVNPDNSVTISPSFTVYPNPTTGKFLVELNHEKDLGKPVVRIYDMTGALIIQRIFMKGKKEEFSLESFPKGIYIINLLGDGISESVNIVRQ